MDVYGIISSGAVRVSVLPHWRLTSGFHWATATPEHREKKQTPDLLSCSYDHTATVEGYWLRTWAAMILWATQLLEWSLEQNSGRSFVSGTNHDGFPFCPAEKVSGVNGLFAVSGKSTWEAWWVLVLREHQVSLTPIMKVGEGSFGVAMGISAKVLCVLISICKGILKIKKINPLFL